jgi:hypothetical protein
VNTTRGADWVPPATGLSLMAMTLPAISPRISKSAASPNSKRVKRRYSTPGTAPIVSDKKNLYQRVARLARQVNE